MVKCYRLRAGGTCRTVQPEAVPGRCDARVKGRIVEMREPKSVADLLTYRVLRLSNTFGLFAGRRYREQFGMRLPEWRVMSIIASWEPTTAREVSRVLATDKGWVGLSVEALRQRGFVKRSADAKDARRSVITLTPQGREMHDAILAIARQRQRRLLAALSQGTAETLIASLDTLQAEADRMLAELEAADRTQPAAKGVSGRRVATRTGAAGGVAAKGGAGVKRKAAS